MTDLKKRCFVLVGGVPPTYDDEDLKKNLRDQTVDMMRCLILTDGAAAGLSDDAQTAGRYALALFGSEKAALAAAKQGIYIGEDKTAFFALQAIRPEQTLSIETTTFSRTMRIEGEDVDKSLLRPTKGLQSVYRGLAVPKWCEASRRNEDCELGTQCRFLHNQHQVTTRRSRVIELDDGFKAELLAANQQRGRLLPGGKRNRDSDDAAASAPETEFEGLLGVPLAELSLSSAVGKLLPSSAVNPFQTVTLSAMDSKVLLGDAGGAPLSMKEDLLNRIQEALLRLKSTSSSDSSSGGSSSIFAKLDTPHGAPTDALLSDLQVLKRRNPLPLSGLPTPQRRDRYLAGVWQDIQRNSLAIPTADPHAAAAAVLELLRKSQKVASILTSHSSTATATASPPLLLTQAIPLESPFHAVQLYFLDGELYTAVQTYDFLSYGGVEADGDKVKHHTAQIAEAVADLVDDIETFLDKQRRISSGNEAEDEVTTTPTSSATMSAFCAQVVVSAGGSDNSPVVAKVVSLHRFEEKAISNSLFPPQPVAATAGSSSSVRFRDRKSAETHHLPSNWLAMIPH